MRPAEERAFPPDGARDEEIDAGDFSGPLEWYWHFSQRNDFQVDSEQLKVLEKLQRLMDRRPPDGDPLAEHLLVHELARL